MSKKLSSEELARLEKSGISPEVLKESFRNVLKAVGENPKREGLLDTPNRFISALLEMTEGYAQSPAQVLGTVFNEEPPDAVIGLRDIPFISLCEHHVLTFSGVVHIGYLPDNRIVGLSKLARIVDVYAKRLQVQERMTKQIAEAIMKHLQPRGVGVIVEGRHSCMSCRGVGKHDATMFTSEMLGAFREVEDLRREFLALVRGGRAC